MHNQLLACFLLCSSLLGLAACRNNPPSTEPEAKNFEAKSKERLIEEEKAPKPEPGIVSWEKLKTEARSTTTIRFNGEDHSIPNTAAGLWRYLIRQPLENNGKLAKATNRDHANVLGEALSTMDLLAAESARMEQAVSNAAGSLQASTIKDAIKAIQELVQDNTATNTAKPKSLNLIKKSRKKDVEIFKKYLQQLTVWVDTPGK